MKFQYGKTTVVATNITITTQNRRPSASVHFTQIIPTTHNRLMLSEMKNKRQKACYAVALDENRKKG
jgi:hypothetical protein